MRKWIVEKANEAIALSVKICKNIKILPLIISIHVKARYIYILYRYHWLLRSDSVPWRRIRHRVCNIHYIRTPCVQRNLILCYWPAIMCVCVCVYSVYCVCIPIWLYIIVVGYFNAFSVTTRWVISRRIPRRVSGIMYIIIILYYNNTYRYNNNSSACAPDIIIVT